MEIIILLTGLVVTISFFIFRKSQNKKTQGKLIKEEEDKELNSKYSALNRLSNEQEKREIDNSLETVTIPIEGTQTIEPFIGDTEYNLVYISPGSKKYHKKDCKFIKDQGNSVDISEARQRGLTQCKVCRPDEI